ncbi:MAG TPA: methyltransferase domain-containing protein [Opitutaceae bacterium]|jgi:ubiquinone/menaquinone biosynthesis C-methylase UbiE|nr:methyltransferase domain-containing protein [Opitutaceae bacterium]
MISLHGEARAMELIVGGDSDVIGILELSVLRTLGLGEQDSLIDVGCGSGRLAVKLVPFLKGKLVGTDILPSVVNYARKICARSDWAFHTTEGFGIPAPDASADFVCFFSVFTHLLYEDTYRYLAEAKRVLKPTGKIVFSFLDFEVPSHWTVFENTLADLNPDRVLNQFLSKEAIKAWSKHLNLEIISLHDGNEIWVNLVKDFVYQDGREAKGTVEFGQSVCVLGKASA